MEDVFKAKDEKIEKLSKVLTKFADGEQFEFVFEGHALKNSDVFGHYGALSLFLIDAQETYEKLANGIFSTQELLRPIVAPESKIKIKESDEIKDKEWMEKKEKEKVYKFPISYHFQDENTFFSFIPRVSEEVACDFYLIAHYTMHSLEEYVKKCKMENRLQDGKIPLDELYNKMLEKINERKIMVIERPYTAPAKHIAMND